MARIKKIASIKVRAASLVETLIATVVIMIVFGIAMATVTNVLERTVRSNTGVIDTELRKLEYLYQHEKIKVPDVREVGEWEIQIKKAKEGELNYIVFQAKHQKTQKKRTQRILEKN